MVSSWSALWSTIWVLSIWKRKLCSPSKTPSGQKCYLCLRNNLLPMSPVWTNEDMELAEGLEPPTRSLQNCRSTD
jgi:hypothetical protein